MLLPRVELGNVGVLEQGELRWFPGDGTAQSPDECPSEAGARFPVLRTTPLEGGDPARGYVGWASASRRCPVLLNRGHLCRPSSTGHSFPSATYTNHQPKVLLQAGRRSFRSTTAVPLSTRATVPASAILVPDPRRVWGRASTGLSPPVWVVPGLSAVEFSRFVRTRPRLSQRLSGAPSARIWAH